MIIIYIFGREKEKLVMLLESQVMKEKRRGNSYIRWTSSNKKWEDKRSNDEEEKRRKVLMMRKRGENIVPQVASQPAQVMKSIFSIARLLMRQRMYTLHKQDSLTFFLNF